MPVPLKLSAPAVGGFWEIPVLYEDEQVLALDKPALLAVQPEPGRPHEPTLLRLLHDAIAAGKPSVSGRGWSFVMNAHRLDAEASGVLLLARSKAALGGLANQFSAGRIALGCLALTRGSPMQETLVIGDRLIADDRRPGLMRVAPQGLAARTEVTVAERFPGISLLRCRVFLGRRHQLRVHLRHARFPVFGDRLYACHALLLSNLKRSYRLKPGHTERPLVDRAAVHVEQVDFLHPVNGNPVSITAPLPKDFQVALKYLRRYATGGGQPRSGLEESESSFE